MVKRSESGKREIEDIFHPLGYTDCSDLLNDKNIDGLWLELVTDPPNGHQMDRIGWVGFNLLT